jgi:hypothetical protein
MILSRDPCVGAGKTALADGAATIGVTEDAPRLLPTSSVGAARTADDALAAGPVACGVRSRTVIEYEGNE